MTDFIPDCYALCHSGRAMPAKWLRLESDHLVTVLSPGGIEYTFHSDAIRSVEEAEEAIRKERILKVATSYRFEELSNSHGRREIRCVNPEHPVRSNYILTIGRARETCSCPSFQSNGQTCKHLVAWNRLAEEKDPRVAARRREHEEAAATARHAERQLAKTSGYAPIRSASRPEECW